MHTLRKLAIVFAISLVPTAIAAYGEMASIGFASGVVPSAVGDADTDAAIRLTETVG